MISRSCMVLVAVASALFGLLGCGGSSSRNCGYYFQVTVTPQTATLDHMAASPANQIQFVGVGRATAPTGCPTPTDLERLEYATWSNPDPDDIQISSARDETNGTAVCLGQTKGPVTLAGTFTPITEAGTSTDTSVNTVTLTCR